MAAARRLSHTVAVITINNPPVNSLSSSVRHALVKEFGEASKDPSVKAIVLSGANGKFSAGADIREFATSALKTASLEDINATIEASKKPVVAAIEGVALGGGLELALACHYRVAHIQSRVGLPEVLIGILPAAGGTQRLPRLIGVPAALDVIVRGRHVPATEALQLGIVDEVVKGDAVNAAIHLARKVIGKCVDHCSSVNCNKKSNSRNELIYKILLGLILLDYVHRLMMMYVIVFMTIIHTSFFLTGLGTMGRGIAISLAKANIPVVALEQDAQQLEIGKKAVNGLLEREAEKLIKQGLAPGSTLASVRFTLDFADLRDTDLVIEAVYENMELKKEIFRKLASVCKPDAFLCTNTSGLNIDEIASVAKNPHLVIGTHFFSPANIMKLLEVVRGHHTSLTTIATAMNLGKTLGKVAVLVGNCPSFVGNRLLGPYLDQANYLLEEGCNPEDVDKALEDFGFAMGPFRMMDLAGLDIGWRSRMESGLAGNKVPLGTPARQREGRRYCPLADLLCENGRLGQKTGKGWYQYEKLGGRIAQPDPWVKDFLQKYRNTHQIKRRPATPEMILECCLYALVNEGFRVLEDGIASGPEDIDVIYNNGYGWPKYRGGPMYYASTVGLTKVLDVLDKYYKENPDVPSMKPAFLLKKLAMVGEPPLKEWRTQVGNLVNKL
ncbi:peroxisomal bifunctional enzyme [Bufo gargarizans]|uniref:peroxisomal bifunctional enzyme n=1 Tax=Bufo gargarizans TaxID=30331 RepID=UPI001CF29C69|nr:peroxisomal bifunctional enzyme [Bufo gargarizans]